MSMCFKSAADFWILPTIFAFWLLTFIFDYNYNNQNKEYKNFLYYIFADKNAPLSNFIHSIITFAILIWIIRLIYTLIYGIR